MWYSAAWLTIKLRPRTPCHRESALLLRLQRIRPHLTQALQRLQEEAAGKVPVPGDPALVPSTLPACLVPAAASWGAPPPRLPAPPRFKTVCADLNSNAAVEMAASGLDSITLPEVKLPAEEVKAEGVGRSVEAAAAAAAPSVNMAVDAAAGAANGVAGVQDAVAVDAGAGAVPQQQPNQAAPKADAAEAPLLPTPAGAASSATPYATAAAEAAAAAGAEAAAGVGAAAQARDEVGAGEGAGVVPPALASASEAGAGHVRQTGDGVGTGAGAVPPDLASASNAAAAAAAACPPSPSSSSSTSTTQLEVGEVCDVLSTACHELAWLAARLTCAQRAIADAPTPAGEEGVGSVGDGMDAEGPGAAQPAAVTAPPAAEGASAEAVVGGRPLSGWEAAVGAWRQRLGRVADVPALLHVLKECEAEVGALGDGQPEGASDAELATLVREAEDYEVEFVLPALPEGQTEGDGADDLPVAAGAAGIGGIGPLLASEPGLRGQGRARGRWGGGVDSVGDELAGMGAPGWTPGRLKAEAAAAGAAGGALMVGISGGLDSPWPSLPAMASVDGAGLGAGASSACVPSPGRSTGSGGGGGFAHGGGRALGGAGAAGGSSSALRRTQPRPVVVMVGPPDVEGCAPVRIPAAVHMDAAQYAASGLATPGLGAAAEAAAAAALGAAADGAAGASVAAGSGALGAGALPAAGGPAGVAVGVGVSSDTIASILAAAAAAAAASGGGEGRPGRGRKPHVAAAAAPVATSPSAPGPTPQAASSTPVAATAATTPVAAAAGGAAAMEVDGHAGHVGDEANSPPTADASPAAASPAAPPLAWPEPTPAVEKHPAAVAAVAQQATAAAAAVPDSNGVAGPAAGVKCERGPDSHIQSAAVSAGADEAVVAGVVQQAQHHVPQPQPQLQLREHQQANSQGDRQQCSQAQATGAPTPAVPASEQLPPSSVPLAGKQHEAAAGQEAAMQLDAELGSGGRAERAAEATGHATEAAAKLGDIAGEAAESGNGVAAALPAVTAAAVPGVAAGGPPDAHAAVMRVKVEAGADARPGAGAGPGAEAGAEPGGSAQAIDKVRQREKRAAGGQAGTPAASRSAPAPSSMPGLTPAKSTAAAAMGKPVTLLSSPHGVVPVTPSKARGVHAAGSVDGVGSVDDGEPQVKIVCSLEELDDSDSEERQRERMERAAHLKYMALAQGQCVLCGRSMSCISEGHREGACGGELPLCCSLCDYARGSSVSCISKGHREGACGVG